MRETIRAPYAANWALSRGISSLNSAELARILDVAPDQVRRRLHAPAQRGEWVSPMRGLWLPVPPEYRAWGAPPGIEIIDPMMTHLHLNYYVGWLSAAAIHGVAHQAPQTFQVATSRSIHARTVGRTRFEFLTRTGLSTMTTLPYPTRSGTARISSVNGTILDVATDITVSGGIDNAATLIIELAEHHDFNVEGLAKLASHFPATTARRIGWMLERFTGRDDLDALHGRSRHPLSPSRLDPTQTATGPVDQRWNLYLNREVQPDV